MKKPKMSSKAKKMQSPQGNKNDKRKPPSSPSPVRVVKKKAKTSRPGTIELSITSTKGGFWLIKSDGYIHPLVKGIEEDAPELESKNFYGKVYQKRSFELDMPKCNAKGFWKYYVMKQAESDIDDTFENRIEHLEFVKEYLQNHNDNTYNNQYVVNRETADETPDELLALDHYIITSNIVEFVQTLHDIDGEDPTWARSNPTEKNWYFSGPTYPFQAKRMLGYSDL